MISAKQLDLLRAVEAGRITWRNPWPRLSERTGRPGIPSWHVDDAEAYGGQHHTLDSLARLRLIEADDQDPAVKLTHDGRQVLAATAEFAALGTVPPTAPGPDHRPPGPGAPNCPHEHVVDGRCNGCGAMMCAWPVVPPEPGCDELAAAGETLCARHLARDRELAELDRRYPPED